MLPCLGADGGEDQSSCRGAGSGLDLADKADLLILSFRLRRKELIKAGHHAEGHSTKSARDDGRHVERVVSGGSKEGKGVDMRARGKGKRYSREGREIR